MAEAEEGPSVAEVYASLRALARDEGARRPDEALLAFLHGDGSALRRALRIDLANGPTNARRTMRGYLLGSVDQLEVRPARQDLKVEQREEQYRYAVNVCFNVSSRGPESGTLTERRNWLNDPARKELKIAQSVCQDDFDHACKQIAERLAVAAVDSEVWPREPEAPIQDDVSTSPAPRSRSKKPLIIALSVVGALAAAGAVIPMFISSADDPPTYLTVQQSPLDSDAAYAKSVWRSGECLVASISWRTFGRCFPTAPARIAA